jgi:serine/threonine protein kinase
MHRDFRCANILVASLQPLVLKAADFGVSHRLSRFTTPGAPSTAAGAHVASVIAGPRGMGPPWWMAPEALEAVVGDGGAVVGVHVTPATDVYMFGGLAFEVLTGGVHPYHWVHADLLLLRRRTAVDVEVRVPGFTPCCGLRHLSTVEAAERDGVAVAWLVDASATATSQRRLHELRQLQAKCLSAEPDARPTVPELQATLSRLIAAEEAALDAARTSTSTTSSGVPHDRYCTFASN